MRRFLACLVVSLLIIALTGCSSRANELDYTVAPLQIGISQHPEPGEISGGTLKRLPRYNHNSRNSFQVDLRGCDLSQLSVDSRLVDLLNADFDSVTKWPQQLPDGFDPNMSMELGRDPGLSVRQLHASGITGTGVGIAIIDQTLLVDHLEYVDRLRHYEAIHDTQTKATMHGAAVASVAVGKTVGVAPDADLYYIAAWPGDFTAFGGFTYDFTWLARSVDRVMEINDTLPDASKIRVIAMQIEFNPAYKGYQEIIEAVERAKQAGIFVVSSSLDDTFSLSFDGLGRAPYADPNDPNSYGPGSWWAQDYFADPSRLGSATLLFPMDARCAASPTGVSDYAYYSRGGWSWSIPYIAGLYALACQVKPDVTPDEFWLTGLRTGDRVTITKDSREFSFGRIVNPPELIAALMGDE